MVTELSLAIQTDEDFIDGDIHQAILNISYRKWNQNLNWQYKDMIKWVENTYGDLAVLSILIGKYNEQVSNGGHIQYYDNNYASIKTEGTKDIELHRKMVKLFEEQDFQNYIINKQEILDIISRFNIEIDDSETDIFICSECGGSGEIEVECPECYGEGLGPDDESCFRCEGTGVIQKTCPECDGTGEIEDTNENFGDVVNEDFLNDLDIDWYKLNDEFMKEFNEFLKYKIIDAEILVA